MSFPLAFPHAHSSAIRSRKTGVAKTMIWLGDGMGTGFRCGQGRLQDLGPPLKRIRSVRAISGARLTNTWTFVARRESLLRHRVSIGKYSLGREALDHEPSFRAHAKLELGDPRGEVTRRPRAAKAQSTCQAGAWRSQGGGHTNTKCSDGAEPMPSWSLAIPGGGHTKAECSDGAEQMPSWSLAIPRGRSHEGRVQRWRT